MAWPDTLLFAQQTSPWVILAVRLVFFLVGIIMVGVGYYAIKHKKLLMSGRQKSFLRLLGVDEVSAKWSTIGGVVQLLIGVVFVVLPVAGPFFGFMSMHDVSKQPQLRKPPPGFNPPRDISEPEDDYEEPAPLQAAAVRLPPLNVADEFIFSTRPFGSGHRGLDQIDERGEGGGVMVGVQLTKGERKYDEFTSVQFIYQVDDRYELGTLVGEEQLQVYRELAKPGFVVGGIRAELFAGRISGLQLIYYALKNGRIDGDADRYESQQWGDDLLDKNDQVDMAQPIVGFRALQRRERLESLRFDFVDTDLVALMAATPDELPKLHYSDGVTHHEVRFWKRVAGGIDYEDRAPSGGVLVGLRVFLPSNKQERIRSVQPVYQTGDAYSVGPPTESAFLNASPKTFLAKPGYAVGGWTFAGKAAGMKIKFMRIQGSRLDIDDSYMTDWIGQPLEEPQKWQSSGDVVVGIKFLEMGDNFAVPALSTATAATEPTVPQPPTDSVTTPPSDVATQVEDAPTIERTWTSDTGQQIKAQLVRLDKEARTVTLQRQGRRPVTIPITKLSEEDQTFLRNLERE